MPIIAKNFVLHGIPGFGDLYLAPGISSAVVSFACAGEKPSEAKRWFVEAVHWPSMENVMHEINYGYLRELLMLNCMKH